MFEPWLEKMKDVGWSGIIGRAPSDEELKVALASKELFLCVCFPVTRNLYADSLSFPPTDTLAMAEPSNTSVRRRFDTFLAAPSQCSGVAPLAS
jgi:hypothetical protein